MSVINNVEDWGNSHRPGFLDFFRIALGVFITYNGAVFASNIESLEMTASAEAAASVPQRASQRTAP